MISQVTSNELEKWLSGQAGFILATVLFGLFFWRVLLPRWDKQNEAINRLANAVKIIAISMLNKDKASGEKVTGEVEKIETGHE